MRVSVIGHFAFGQEASDGQTIKTKILTRELTRQLGENEVNAIDTHGGIKSLFKAPFQVISALKKSKNVIMLPAHNGLRVYGRLLPMLRTFFRGRKIHYAVIGGWLPEFVRERSGLAASLKKFDGIYVETNTMKKALEAQGFDNVFVMPNCKELKILNEDELVYSTQEPYKLCTFSRVMKEKGIGDAAEAVKAVNEKLGRTAFTLDIYGKVDDAQTEWFDELKKTFPEYVRYGGLVPFDKSVDVLKNYFALLFPTHYHTEGIPGTIIDAYAAGVPVISAKWESFFDIVEDGKSGLGYEFGNSNNLFEILLEIANKPDTINVFKIYCLSQAKGYIPQSVVGEFIKYLS